MERPAVHFRKWKYEDKDSLLKYANNKKIFDNMRDMYPYPYTSEAADNYLKRATGDEAIKIFAIEINGEAAGSIGIFPKDDIEKLNAEVGYWIAEEYWGKGVATQALKFIIDYGFSTFAVDRIFAIPFPHNIASQKVIQKSGMALEAIIKDSLIKNGMVMDQLIYAIRRDTWEKNKENEQA